MKTRLTREQMFAQVRFSREELAELRDRQPGMRTESYAARFGRVYVEALEAGFSHSDAEELARLEASR
jgi:hypothetical protein